MASFTVPKRLTPLQPPIARIRSADPLLMSAAIAYNFFFALVPLAIAAVAWLGTVGRTEEGIAAITEILHDALPSEVADYVLSLVEEAQSIVGAWQGPVIVISLLIALYAGSRGIYAVQKAIRQIEDVEEDRRWLVVRGLGILFTLGAGVALVGGYVVVLFSGFIFELLDRLGIQLPVSWVSISVLALWLVVVLYAIYRWGPPLPIQRPLVAAVVATVILGLMTWLAAVIIPAMGGTNSTTLSTLGAVGVVLVWLYAIGFVVITVPALVKPAELVIRGTEA